MRIVTWNVNSLKARLPRVTEWIEEVRPEVLCLQETKMADEAFPALHFEELGYTGAHFGQGRWNGVAIISRVGLDDVVAMLRGGGGGACCCGGGGVQNGGGGRCGGCCAAAQRHAGC